MLLSTPSSRLVYMGEPVLGVAFEVVDSADILAPTKGLGFHK